MSKNETKVPRRKRENETAVQVALRQVANDKEKLSTAETRLWASIIHAHGAGASYRELGRAAGMNHERIRRMVNR